MGSRKTQLAYSSGVLNAVDTKQVALITGSNRGIGFETARQLGERGVIVIVSACTGSEAAEAAGILRKESIVADSVVLDVTKAMHQKWHQALYRKRKASCNKEAFIQPGILFY